MIMLIDNLLVLGASSTHDVAAADAGTQLSSIDWLVQALVQVGMATIILGVVLCLYRLWKGPHLADRVLCADTIATHVVALVILLAVQMRTLLFFDAALVVSIIGFASTIAFAQYIASQSNQGKA